MPTVLRSGAYRFFFYSADREEPAHVHVARGSDEAKFWLEPVRLAWSQGFSGTELRKVEAMIRESAVELLESWNEFFSD